MYGLPKVHKDEVPLRPILAAYKAPSVNLSKFLIRFMQPLTTNQYTIKNSYEFKEAIKDIEFPDEVYLASFDVVSLFTNVPVRETMNIVLDSLYESVESISNITKTQFKKLLELCVNDNHFLFNQEHFA